MNPDTGAIAHFETEEDAKRAGHTVPLTDKEAVWLATYPREQRAKQYKALSCTKKLPASRVERRSKRKSQRKARRANRGR